MTIKYIDEVGVIAREIDNNYGIEQLRQELQTHGKKSGLKEMQ